MELVQSLRAVQWPVEGEYSVKVRGYVKEEEGRALNHQRTAVDQPGLTRGRETVSGKKKTHTHTQTHKRENEVQDARPARPREEKILEQESHEGAKLIQTKFTRAEAPDGGGPSAAATALLPAVAVASPHSRTYLP